MLKLKKYKHFKESIDSTENSRIIYVCNSIYDLEDYTINTDGTVDVDGDVHIWYRELTEIAVNFNEVNGTFHCQRNELTSLVGSPRVVKNFDCSDNNLTSLEGCPEIISGWFDCSHNLIRDLNHFPKVIGGSFIISFTPLSEVFKLFPTGRYVEVASFLIEYNVIRDGDKVVLQALELVYDELGLEVPENIEIEGYKLI